MFNTREEAIAFADGKNQDDGGIPRFYKKAVAYRNGEEVDWKDEVWVEIINKGDSKNIMERQKRPEDEKRWPNFWQAFLNDCEPDIEGIPLTEFPQITPAEIQRCKQKGILSVEDLAALPDTELEHLGPRAFSLRKSAVDYMDYREGTTIKNLEEQIETLMARIAELEDKDGTDSITDDPERVAGDKPSETIERDEGRPGLGEPSPANFGDHLP